MRKSKNRYFYHIFVSPGDAPGAITLNVVWMERDFDAYNCVAECAHLIITVSEIERDIGRKSSIFHTPLHSTPPLGGFPSEYRHPVWYGKTRVVWLPDGEKISKISLFVLAQLTNVTDAQTDRRTPGDGTVLMNMHRAVKTKVAVLAEHSVFMTYRYTRNGVG